MESNSGSYSDNLFPRERDITFSYISSGETRLWLKDSKSGITGHCKKDF